MRRAPNPTHRAPNKKRAKEQKYLTFSAWSYVVIYFAYISTDALELMKNGVIHTYDSLWPFSAICLVDHTYGTIEKLLKLLGCNRQRLAAWRNLWAERGNIIRKRMWWWIIWKSSLQKDSKSPHVNKEFTRHVNRVLQWLGQFLPGLHLCEGSICY